MTRCLVNRVLHTDCVIRASIACALQMHTLSLLLYHTYPLSPSPNMLAKERELYKFCNAAFAFGTESEKRAQARETSVRATKRNEYVTHGADTCEVGGLGGLSVMVGLREEQHNVVSVEWITTATREGTDCFLCENHPTPSHLDLSALTAQPVCCPFQSYSLLSVC